MRESFRKTKKKEKGCKRNNKIGRQGLERRERARERESVCVCVCLCVCERERER